MYRLADVSHWNRVSSFASVDGVYLKAGEGVIERDGEFYTDPTFKANVSLARTQHKPWGAYWFGRPKNDPIAQARRFWQLVQSVGGSDLRLMLDLEATDGLSPAHVDAWAVKFLTELERLAGHTPGVYTFADFVKRGCCRSLGRFPLWFARIIRGAKFDDIPIPPPWHSMVLWQAGQITIPGIGAGDGPGVDVDYCPDLAPLLITGKPAPNPSPQEDDMQLDDSLGHVGWSKDEPSVREALSDAAAGGLAAQRLVGMVGALTASVEALTTALHSASNGQPVSLPNNLPAVIEQAAEKAVRTVFGDAAGK